MASRPPLTGPAPARPGVRAARAQPLNTSTVNRAQPMGTMNARAPRRMKLLSRSGVLLKCTLHGGEQQQPLAAPPGCRLELMRLDGGGGGSGARGHEVDLGHISQRGGTGRRRQATGVG
ncbi:unnamed protein product [Lampetra planeri]